MTMGTDFFVINSTAAPLNGLVLMDRVGEGAAVFDFLTFKFLSGELLECLANWAAAVQM